MPLADARSRLQQSRERLLAAISGITEEQFKRRPAASESDPRPWCIAEVLAHLLLTEREWSRCIALALSDDGVAVTSPAQTAVEEQTRASRMAPVPQLIHGLLAARRDLERRLDVASASDALDRTVQHAETGIMTLEAMADRCVANEAEHIAQIEALRVQVGARPSP